MEEKGPDKVSIRQEKLVRFLDDWLIGRWQRFKQDLVTYLSGTLDSRLGPLERQLEELKQEVFRLQEENEELRHRVEMSEQQQRSIDIARGDAAAAIAIVKREMASIDLLKDYVLGSTPKVSRQLKVAGAEFKRLMKQAEALSKLEGHGSLFDESLVDSGFSTELKKLVE